MVEILPDLPDSDLFIHVVFFVEVETPDIQSYFLIIGVFRCLGICHLSQVIPSCDIPLKTNMDTQNSHVWKEIHFKTHHSWYLVSMLDFGGVSMFFFGAFMFSAFVYNEISPLSRSCFPHHAANLRLCQAIWCKWWRARMLARSDPTITFGALRCSEILGFFRCK